MKENSMSNSRLRDALLPFVRHYDIAGPAVSKLPDDAECTVYPRVTHGDLRRAWRAIANDAVKEAYVPRCAVCIGTGSTWRNGGPCPHCEGTGAALPEARDELVERVRHRIAGWHTGSVLKQDIEALIARSPA